MRHKTTILLILALAVATIAFAGAAQGPQSYPAQPAPGAPSGMMVQGQSPMGGGVMMGMSMGMMMGQMSAHHEEINETMAKVMQSFSALQYEKNENKLRSKLADHRALLNELQTELNEEGSAMRNMAQVMAGAPPAGPSGLAPSK